MVNSHKKVRPSTDILGVCLGIITKPSPTLGDLCRREPLGQALVVFLVVVLVPTLASVFSQFSLPLDELEANLPELAELDIEQLVQSIRVATVIGTPIFGLVALAVIVGMYHLLSLLFKGRGAFGGLFVGFAFSTVPLIFYAPLALLPLAFGFAGVSMTAVGALVILSWISTLQWIALRENYGFSWGRSLLVYSIPVIVLPLLLITAMTIMLIIIISQL